MAKSKQQPIGPDDLPPDLLKAMKNLLAYAWDDELEDATENGADDHVFSDLVTIKNFVEGDTKVVSDYIGDDEDGEEDDEDDEEDDEDEEDEDDEEEEDDE